MKFEGTPVTLVERRRSERIPVQIPVFIRGVDSSGDDFFELTKTIDFSSTGAYLASLRRFPANQLLSLSIPAPSSAAATLPAETPPIQARVRRCNNVGGAYLLGVEFLKPLEKSQA